MDVSFGFKVCRVCLKSSQETLLSTVEANLENAEVFYKVGRIDITKDYNKHDVMICESCWSNLQEADKLIRTFKNENDFESKRKETTGGFRILSEVRETEKRFFVCRCCLASQTIVFLKIINEFEAEKLKVVTGIEIRAGESTVCISCAQLFAKSFNIRKDIEEAELFYFTCRRAEVKEELTVKTRTRLRNIQGGLNVEYDQQSSASEGGQTNLKIWECNICKKRLSRRDHLRDHIRNVHQKIKRYACDYCGYLDYFKNSLKDHMIRHHINLNPKNKKVNSKSRLTNIQEGLNVEHKQQNSASKGGQKIPKIWECNICKKHLSRKIILRNHMRNVHEKIKRNSCDRCECSYYSKSSLLRHMIQHHINVNPKNKKVNSKSRLTNIQDGLNVEHKQQNSASKGGQKIPEIWECNICKKHLSRKSTLRHHMRNVHEEIKRNSCDHCECSYYSKFALKYHMARQHISLNPDKDKANFSKKSI